MRNDVIRNDCKQIVLFFRWHRLFFFRSWNICRSTFDFTHTNRYLVGGRRLNMPAIFSALFAQSSARILYSFYRISNADWFSPKIMRKLFTIIRIFADYLPLNDLGTSCYGQKQMKKIHCFDFFACVYSLFGWQQWPSQCIIVRDANCQIRNYEVLLNCNTNRVQRINKDQMFFCSLNEYEDVFSFLPKTNECTLWVANGDIEYAARLLPRSECFHSLFVVDPHTYYFMKNYWPFSSLFTLLFIV